MRSKRDSSLRDRNYEFEDLDVLRRRQRRRRKRTSLLLTVLGILLLLLFLAAAGVLIYGKWRDGQQDARREQELEASAEASGEPEADIVSEKVYTQAELDALLEEAKENAREEASEEILEDFKRVLSVGDTSMVEMLRPYYEDELVIVSSGKFHFVPVVDSIPKNDYVWEKVNVLESGEYQYVEEGQVISHKGIDVSKFQGDIDWETVAAEGVEFAFIRVGNRGYGSEGKLVEDDRFQENMEGALQAGIKVGVYFYTQALNQEELLEEAELVLKKIAPYKIECPVVFDVEKVSGAKGRMNALSVEERTDLTLLFCQTIEEAGYQPMIYFNMEMAALMLDLERLEGYDKWLAYYNPECYYPYEYKVWQYSQHGRVNGIQGDVDLNISFQPLWD